MLNPQPHAIRPGRTAPDVADAMGHLRHSARILALAITGLIHSPDEVQGRQRGPHTYDADDDWTNDVQSLALDIVSDLEKILNVMEAEGKS